LLYAGTFGGGVFDFQLTSIDIALTKIDTPDPVTINKNLTYTITVTNNGTSLPATGVTITDTLPPNVTLVSVSPLGACPGITTLTCSLGVLPPGASASVSIIVRPREAGVISNTAQVTGNEIDANPSNNTVTVTTTVEGDNDGDGFSVGEGDCDDTAPTRRPGAPELCNGLDDDCDGQTDEGLASQNFYPDADNDGYGNPAAVVRSCVAPAGYILNGGDCNDANAAIHPGAVDVCGDNVDQDCSGFDLACPPLQIISPNGGEVWPVRTKQIIQWHPQGVTGLVNIELSRDGGTTWEIVRRKSKNDGQQLWRVKKPITSQAKIRVSSVVNPAISDTSDALFHIP
jgi:uncharacterized repeat protein (TIGR01451 family)